jgi:HD-GYP domain-containing protein (c-di-GMP phosphodiesterase class II)
MTASKETKTDVLTSGGEHGPELDESVRYLNEAGPLFIHYLFSASKTVQVHDLSNRAAQRVLTEVWNSAKEIVDTEGRLVLRISIDYLLINDVRVTVDPQHFGPFLHIMQEMQERDVEGIEFLSGFTVEETGRFFKIFFTEVPEEDIFAKLQQKLAEADVTHFRLVQWVERERHLEDYSTTRHNVRQEGAQAFFRTVSLMKEILQGIEERRAIQVKKAERLTQQMVDILKADESILVGLASIKNFDEYTFAHSVNVCILSMLIGDRLRLYKSDIARLGVAALFHDIGKVYIPQNVLNYPGKLSDKDWELMKYHTIFGVKELSRVKSLREVTEALFVTLQHHINYNMDGYPQKPGEWELPLFTRIVTVADYFDAMTSPRAYCKTPMTADKALRYIMLKSGEIFDPFIAKVFIQAMGLFPIGTVVELDTGERGVVVKQNGTTRYMRRPQVALIDDKCSIDTSRETIDLSEQDESGNFRRSISRVLSKETSELQIRDWFVKQGP